MMILMILMIIIIIILTTTTTITTTTITITITTAEKSNLEDDLYEGMSDQVTSCWSRMRQALKDTE